MEEGRASSCAARSSAARAPGTSRRLPSRTSARTTGWIWNCRRVVRCARHRRPIERRQDVRTGQQQRGGRAVTLLIARAGGGRLDRRTRPRGAVLLRRRRGEVAQRRRHTGGGPAAEGPDRGPQTSFVRCVRPPNPPFRQRCRAPTISRTAPFAAAACSMNTSLPVWRPTK